MKRLWIVCTVAAVGHLALLHAAGLWTPLTVRNNQPADLRLVWVAPPMPSTGEAAIGNGQPSTGSQPTPTPPEPSGIPQKPSLPTEARLPQEGATPGIPRSEDIDGVRFYTSTEVDRQALPASALELLDVMTLVTDASPMMVRVYIDRDGTVARAEIVSASDANHAAAARLALILMETRFVPAKRLGADVAAVRELQFQIEPSGQGSRPALAS
ncbi:hypothetical protein ACN9M1_12640 [Ralstonia sp. R-29]|uniref:hypothetical protein n=1 Tax=Ralstonia sp. R-29 TaxID=3404059 RepID=UPI003CF7DEE6